MNTNILEEIKAEEEKQRIAEVLRIEDGYRPEAKRYFFKYVDGK